MADEIKRLVFLAPSDSYSSAAAKNIAQAICPSAQLDPQVGFNACFAAVGGEVSAVVPIENSREGLIGSVSDALFRSNLFIRYEYILPIEHRLFALEGAGEIKKIVTHPEAHNQCRGYLENAYPNISVEYAYSTAGALEHLDDSTGAIAGTHIKKDGIRVVDDMSSVGANYTRFVVLTDRPTEHSSPCRVSVMFVVPHRAGSLVRILNILDRYGVNMTGIASRPTKHEDWRYYFSVDIDCTDAQRTEAALDEVRQSTEHFRYLGRYCRL